MEEIIMKYAFTPRGVCSARIEFELEGNTVKNVEFTRGCSGNTQGVAALCEGMDADEVIKRLEGINCGGKGTSCPDQLAKAIKMAKEQEK
ncbi:MAG TPA: TIGR03905 family TSCPD domain-containing protein [Candidatus Ornithomonoglobus merdipullorum]|uniref:ribonucleoside-diphosphate reductase n=1 Tax=Candidatus Ornithomonoglobus merdipullorum TaxID=2840895 RepID=A0A9D1SEK4_9FIRM|nr:TIGR03905 family TSCPD domain-containing protein [Candidatus Ornithomonoglobus merdipullorum]